MKIVGVAKAPAEHRREFFADGRLAATGDTHQQHDHGIIELPSLRTYRVTAFIEIEVIEHGHDRPVLQAAFPDPPRENFRAGVAPAALHHETVPNLALFVRPCTAT